MTNYLLEIGLEEIPAHLVTPSINQLAERMEAFLNENRLKFDKIIKFSTPRRLALIVEELSDSSEAIDEEVKGPSAKIAKDAEGNWSKAIQGFSRGQGATPDDLILKGDYYYAKKHVDGVKSEEILSKVGDEVIAKMTFSTYMKWGNNDFLFVRPIQWIVSLLEDEIVAFDLLDVTANRFSRGHRFLANVEIELKNANDYASKMPENFVLVDAEHRKAEISAQILALASENNWQVTLHKDLLEEVNNIVEYPTAFVGSFDPKYLSVPAEVLVTSMRDNQRYFEVYNQEGQLAPNFISVRNGNAEHIENVVLGNEKVLFARLEDAEFFWKEDQKLKIEDLVAKLAKVTFHAKIGSITEHMARTKLIAAKLADIAGLTDEEKVDVARSAEIYKFDLLTGMVGEFDELQGVMGEKYALLAGENANVAAAIREHYMPTSADGQLPETKVGSVLAAADKIDSVLSFFNVGLIPSGSNDPYALRRAVQGLIRIIEKMNWHFDLSLFIDQFEGQNHAEILEFVKARVQKLLLEKLDRYDIVEAAINSSNFDITNMMESAFVIDGHKLHEPFKPAIENVSRSINLVKKAADIAEINPALFEEDTEQALYDAVISLQNQWTYKPCEEKFRAIVHMLAPAIEAFFDNVMVMAEDLAVRDNRIALLSEVVALTSVMADFSLINTK
ncbi:glycine--tRNA ligase subunit beta [Lactococcus cremoris]|uniref:Glycine--tRNA ligase beta subunit n=1 Tax=Lactococcus lactis subsp. cremoris (strain MG1363) TaxID=416870 RepID=SYGB_LACLM|nr:glycine--tRNA ligase subunit beta [Lactococcus cremoris]A2RL88.1 RecName: Full=Glycine--tRNA ligase beta subunit; AltName: Full=Glycyl-tRNA synthetase beta subunit; Short=GlyRS [Lactococcus cremoris subsp. cremoris MG1363]ADJ60465.1 glycyl-tRNA synthetase subunit beta [Lactococcus cremoris subsp. cremoris NZ9000]KZK53408.1 Glycyl-tRNA synthetase beta chain [Lactococcus cremoris]MCT4434792.1 glycine--tRNA ligase subunit beta [Lactococcus cremoris]MCT4447044.1 glycine--tRNA ligase subunit bet